MSKSEFRKIKKQKIEEIGHCELCGSRTGLELHHCIPVAYGGKDDEDNLILVCRGCHAKLTPKSDLVKKGMNGVKYDTMFVPIRRAVLLRCWECDMFDRDTILNALDYVTFKAGFKNYADIENYISKIVDLQIETIQEYKNFGISDELKHLGLEDGHW